MIFSGLEKSCQLPVNNRLPSFLHSRTQESPRPLTKLRGQTNMVFLGNSINSTDMTIELPDDKYQDSMTLKANCNDRRKRQLKARNGKLGCVSKVVHPTQMFLRRLFRRDNCPPPSPPYNTNQRISTWNDSHCVLIDICKDSLFYQVEE